MVKAFTDFMNKLMSRRNNEINYAAREVKHHINRSQEILNSIKQQELEELPSAIYLLLGHEELKLNASRVIFDVVSKLSAEKLGRLDLLFRERNSLDWSYDWRSEDPSNMLSPVMSEEEKIVILGLCSFYPNGYFREKALKLLGEFENGAELSYIAIRLNDWVYPVRKLAKDILRKKLIAKNARAIVNNLPLFFRLENCSRDSHVEIMDMLNSLLTDVESREEVAIGLTDREDKVRYYCYEIAMNSEAFSRSTLIGYVIKEKVPHIRLRVVRYIVNTMTAEELSKVYKLLIKDKNSLIRTQVLLAADKKGLIDISKELKASLLDSSVSVREVSRFLLKKREFNNFGLFYREAITKEENLVGAIYGLSEVGTAEDCELIEGYINSDIIKLQKATMTALAKLAYEKYRLLFIGKLKDERPGVSKRARRILTEKIDDQDSESIYSIYKEAVHKYTAKNALFLLFSLSKWESIRYIIEATGSTDEEIRNLSQYYLLRWKAIFNRGFNKPTEKQKILIKETINKYGKYLDRESAEFVRFSVE